MTDLDPDRQPSSPAPAGSVRFAWRVLRNDPWAWGIALALWVTFFALPLPAGLALRAVLDELGDPAGDDAVWALLAALAGMELGRWVVLLPAVVQWHGGWVFWHTVPRVNVLRSLVADPGPVTGRLPGSPGEAVSRFRDDARSVAEVLDVWLDVCAAVITSVAGLAVLFAISPPAAGAVVLPIVVVLWIGHLLAGRLRGWRWAERRATAEVTSFIGDAFGAITAVKVAAAEQAVLGHFVGLGDRRARAARRDQVGTQVSQTLGGITANAGLGLALLAVAPALRGGDLSIGDIGLFSAYATAIGSLPRITARWAAWQRQADVSVARLGRLLPERTPDRAAAPVATWLRHGPPAFDPPPITPPAGRTDSDRLERLEVRGLTVRLDGARQLHAVDLIVERGQLVVVTGAVGAGKSILLRALLGLVAAEDGVIRWNDEAVADPSLTLVPPRVAYVPQVPRLFSEPLADTVLLGLAGDGLDDALRRARLDEDLTAMPHGRATLVGPKGVRLSGGQIQRTATARALVRRPELLVVDDLSSALDVATESALWAGLLDDADDELTVLAVSHRPHVLARADQVVTLDAGRIT